MTFLHDKITITEAAKDSGFREHSIRRDIHNKKLKASKPGGHYLIKLKDYNDWLDKKREKYDEKENNELNTLILTDIFKNLISKISEETKKELILDYDNKYEYYELFEKSNGAKINKFCFRIRLNRTSNSNKITLEIDENSGEWIRNWSSEFLNVSNEIDYFNVKWLYSISELKYNFAEIIMDKFPEWENVKILTELNMERRKYEKYLEYLE